MIVLDASAAAEMLLGTERGFATADALRGAALTVPAHFDAEVYHALRRARRRSRISPAVLEDLLRRLSTLAAERVELPPLLASANALGVRFSPPDSLYVALARALDAELLTCDEPLAVACDGVTRVRLI